MHRPFLDTHEVFETPVLFRVAEMKLQLEPQTILVDQQRIAQGHITAA
jgi:primosomal protein N''